MRITSTTFTSKVAAYQQPLRQFGSLDLVPREWLHITVQGVAHVHAVTNTQRDRLVQAVSQRLASIPPPRLTFSRPVLHREAVAIPPTDPAPLAAIQHAIRAGIEVSYGVAEGDPETFRPHVSVAYVNAPADVAPVRAALDAVQAEPAEALISHLSLIELHRDNRMYEWTTVATVALGAA